MNEAQRVREAYQKRFARLRAGEINPRDYSCFEPSHLLLHHSRERVMLRLLEDHRFYPLGDHKILDVGCGDGIPLQEFIKYGAVSQNLYGVDLLDFQVKRAVTLNPAIHFLQGNADHLPFASASFDLVMQWTVFTSVLNQQTRSNIAGEMLRALKPDGLILWYDFWPNNPRNPDVRGVKAAEIKALFPNCRFDLRRVVLAPPIARCLAKRFWLLCQILEHVPLLCTHYILDFGQVKRIGHRKIG